jgi:hypothetical protein
LAGKANERVHLLDKWLSNVLESINDDTVSQAHVLEFLQRDEDCSSDDDDVESGIVDQKSAAIIIAKLESENLALDAKARAKDQALAIALRQLKKAEERLKICDAPKSISQIFVDERPQVTLKARSASDVSMEEFKELQKLPRGLKLALFCQEPVNPPSVAAGGNYLGALSTLNLRHLRSLVRLHLQHANLVGQIPPNMGDLRGLQSLDLRANRLLGEIPLGIGQLLNLQELFLDNNQLTGQLPLRTFLPF